MTPGQYAVAATLVDAVHAALMFVFFAGLPLLFVYRWPRVSLGYAAYAVSFVVLSQGSQLLWGHCFFTPFAGWLWNRSGWPVDSTEWFTVRLSKLVFHFAPSQHIVSRLGDAAVLITAVGAILRIRSHLQKVRTRRALAGIEGASPPSTPVSHTRAEGNIVVAAHSDSQHPASNDQERSERRAQAVADDLVSRGIAKERVTVKGFGRENPLTDKAPSEAQAQNRRVETVVDRPKP